MTMFDSAVSAGVANVGSVVLKDDGFLEFYNEFDRNLDDLQAALKKTKQTKALAESLKSRGTFKNFMGGFTGRNDKELAEMIGDLGASMEVTQVILQMVMQVNNTKNGYLRQFHQALVEKITSLTSDTKPSIQTRRLPWRWFLGCVIRWCRKSNSKKWLNSIRKSFRS